MHLKIAPTGIKPAILLEATAARPMDAIQPQLEQSGFPPNWQGVIRVRGSAETVAVVSAKIHSDGLAGGAETD
jgi:hypothetical protein